MIGFYSLFIQCIHAYLLTGVFNLLTFNIIADIFGFMSPTFLFVLCLSHFFSVAFVSFLALSCQPESTYPAKPTLLKMKMKQRYSRQIKTIIICHQLTPIKGIRKRWFPGRRKWIPDRNLEMQEEMKANRERKYVVNLNQYCLYKTIIISSCGI